MDPPLERGTLKVWKKEEFVFCVQFLKLFFKSDLRIFLRLNYFC